MSRVVLVVAAVVALFAVAQAQPTPPVICQQYCGIMFANCTGANAQYGAPTLANQGWCITECIVMLNRTGTPGATTGNSFQCRWTYAQLAAGGISPATNCPYATPWSSKCMGSGNIGTTKVPVPPLCESLCDKQAYLCGGSITPTYHNPFFKGAAYTSAASGATSTTLSDWEQCLVECAIYPYMSAQGAISTTSGDSRSCRYTHITLAAKNPTAQYLALHCPHSGPAGGSPASMACYVPPPAQLPSTKALFVWGYCNNYCDILQVGLDGHGVCPGLTVSPPQVPGEAYPDYQSCMGACMSFPFVTTFNPLAFPQLDMTVATGNSYECRRHWGLQTLFDATGNSASQVNVPGDCLIAGSFGGDLPTGTPTCGDACHFYCDEVVGTAFNNYTAHCPTHFGWGPTAYASCLAACVDIPRATFQDLTTALLTTNTLECRCVWAGLAANVTINAAACAAASVNGQVGFCGITPPPPPPSSTAGSMSSTGLSGAATVKVSLFALLAACFAAFVGSRRF